MSGMASMQGGTVTATGLVNTQTLNPRPAIPRCRLPEDALLSSSRSTFICGFKLRTTRPSEDRRDLKKAGHREHLLNVKHSATMSPSQGMFLFRAAVASPMFNRGIVRKDHSYYRILVAHKSSGRTESYDQIHPKRAAGVLGLTNDNYSQTVSSEITDVDLSYLMSKARNQRHIPRAGRQAVITGLNPTISNPVQYLKEPVLQHQIVSSPNTAVQYYPTGRVPAVVTRTAQSAWVNSSRTVRVALQARLKHKSNMPDLSSLPQYSQRDSKSSSRTQKHPVVARQSLDLSYASSAVDLLEQDPGEAWVRAAEKLGFGPTRSLATSASRTEALKSIEPFFQVDPRKGATSLQAVAVNSNSENVLVRVQSEPSRSAEQGYEETLPSRVHAGDESDGRCRERSHVVHEDDGKPAPSKKKNSPRVKLKENHKGETIVDSNASGTTLLPVESSTEEMQKETPSVSNDSVMIIDSVEKATMVVEHLMGEYRHCVHACDTEVANIDVKKESPVGHGRITCFSIYCGPTSNFGDGKNRLWIDVLDGGEDVLLAFKPYFEDPSIMKVWHNYSFDKHILSRHGILTEGFYADTMHLARLWDSARQGQKRGGYSLEVLSGDENVMDGYANHLDEEDGHAVAGKKSMKDLFGKANMKKDGTPGKLKVIPPVEEIQRGEEWRELWIHYSTFDAVCTWRLWQSLQKKLKGTPWNVLGVGKKGCMYDFYEKYWRPFGDVLVKMEADGMLVDCDYLATIEKVARNQQKTSVSRFRKWATKYCPDAAFMNVGSDAQIRQLLFGGTANRKNPDEVLPLERVFSVPNTEGIIEKDKKVAKKTRPIVIKGLAAFNIKIPVDTYTSSGWPAVGGAAIKALAGKVAIDYTDLDADSDKDLIEEDLELEGLLTSAGVQGDNGEDLSIYGKAYRAFGGGQEGKEACMALAALCEVASINTLISNFIEPLQGNEIKSTSDGRVHCSLNINTETGRLSARRPSLQNQPALEKDRYRIRESFVAAPGKSLVVADYGQLELRILAHLAKCRSMKEAFIAGGDFHSRTAMNMYPHVRDAVEKEKVLLEWEGHEKPPVPLLKDVFGSERRKAKMLNFSIAYGKTAMGLAKDWKVSIEEAKATVNLWYSDRPEVLAWQKERKEEAHRTQKVHTLLGRARHLPEVKSTNPLVRSHMERAAINTPVQGSAADVAMCAMLEINQNVELRELGWRLLLQVHDEVILEGPTESAEEALALVKQCMMYPFDGVNFLDVELAVDGKHALNWYSAK